MKCWLSSDEQNSSRGRDENGMGGDLNAAVEDQRVACVRESFSSVRVRMQVATAVLDNFRSSIWEGGSKVVSSGEEMGRCRPEGEAIDFPAQVRRWRGEVIHYHCRA
jgi:hypothetical protein